MRSQEAIVARYEASRDDDFLGFKAEVLLSYVDFEHAKPFLKKDAKPENWTVADPAKIEEAAREYFAFAVGKALDHRGISASRSVTKLREFAWLMERSDVVDAMDSASYENYGVPKLAAFANGMGFTLPGPGHEGIDHGKAAWDRMAQGLPCRPDGCDDGCGR